MRVLSRFGITLFAGGLLPVSSAEVSFLFRFWEKSMRIPSSVFAVAGKALVLLIVAGSIVIVSGQKATNTHGTAAVTPQAAVQYVNPGLVFSVVSAKIASDGTISVDYKITDGAATGLPLDINGIQTPGVVSPRFLAAYIPKGQEQFSSYITTVATAVTGGATATQAAGDSGGTTTTVAVGEYVYTFKTKAPAGFDPTLTNRIGIYGSRNLTEWDMGTADASVTYDFVPAGGTPNPRDVVRQADCNSCHSTLSFHGGSRVGVSLCIMCHQPQTSDPNTGESLDAKVFIHKIHMGSSLPTVKVAGQPYQIYGHGGYSDWSTVVYPANPSDPRNCAGSCHNPKNGAAQTNAWMTKPSRAACGSCHDDVNFATGASTIANNPGYSNHLPQIDDSQCSECHIPQGELPFDASIIGAHTVDDQAPGVPGLNFTLVKVTGAAPGKAPTVSFTVKDNNGNGIPMSYFAANSGSLSLTTADPTTDYGYTSFGSTVTTPGYVTESAMTASTCDSAGDCTYTFTHTIPANAKGTYIIGIEGRLSITLLPGTTQAVTTSYGGTNQIINFSVDGSPVAPRRTIVAMANCQGCHTYLEVHGDLRNNVQYCVLCHNPSEGDESTRPTATVASDKTAPVQGINFAQMIHSIHTGANLGTSYIIVGHGGSHNDFGEAWATVPSTIPDTGVRYPAMINGSVGDTANCSMCHVNGSEAVLPVGKNPVYDPAALINPVPATTSACTACHNDVPTMAHAVINTDPKFGESCTVCHAAGMAYDVTVEHAGK
jgi:OmcA/MtrC family decaheme c-type cytochrome